MSVPKTDERAGATPASIVPTARSGSTGKIVSARAAVRLIRTGDTVAPGGFFNTGLALEVVHALAAVFEAPDEGPVALPTQAW
jgi:propionate CoA-transferase